jgi:hypothetical protein
MNRAQEMRSVKIFYKLFAAGFVSLTFFAACTAGDTRTYKKPLLLDPQFSALQVEHVALLPVAFLDNAQDRYYQMRAGDEIRLTARKTLERKGYRVEFIEGDAEREFWLPYTPKTTNPAKLAELARENADALVFIQVDHFLDAGIYDSKSPQALQVYATATMLSTKNSTEIWRGEGFGGGGQILATPHLLEVNLMQVSAELAKSLFVTLPNAVK